MEIKKYEPGTFSWVDLSVKDPKSAKKFYGDLFGWTFTDVPTGDKGIYTMANLRGKEVAALMDMPADELRHGGPAHWNCYVTVGNVEKAAAKVKELGGQVLVPTFDVMEEGRMAVIQDPGGAILSLWEGKRHQGAELMGEPNTLCWNELYTKNVDIVGSFYTKLLNWTAQVQNYGMPVTIFSNQGKQVATMMEIQKAWGEMPSYWLAYFCVEDCDRSFAKAKSLGATVIVEPQNIPSVGRFATLQDPQGAVFSIIKLVDGPATN